LRRVIFPAFNLRFRGIFKGDLKNFHDDSNSKNPMMRLYSILLVVCMLFLSGCGGQKLPEGMPKLTAVELTIMQDGTALEGAIVSLLPLDSDNSRWNAGGVTDKNGKAKIRTLSQYDGVAAGKYQVTVVKTYVEPLPDWFKTATEAERRSYKSPPSVELVHKKFAGKKTTPLDLEVGSTPVQQTLEVEKP